MKRLLILTSLAAALVCSCGTPNKSYYDEYSNEAVNIGYGAVRRSELLGAASTVNVAKEREFVTYESIYDYIKDRVPGLEVVGYGGGAPSIRIRGDRSINGDNEPLFIVDGAQVYDLSYINPADVESVTVLKDASLTAAYGSRGANGVIIVNLKRN